MPASTASLSNYNQRYLAEDGIEHAAGVPAGLAGARQVVASYFTALALKGHAITRCAPEMAVAELDTWLVALDLEVDDAGRRLLGQRSVHDVAAASAFELDVARHLPARRDQVVALEVDERPVDLYSVQSGEPTTLE